jgi:hypothetical protein
MGKIAPAAFVSLSLLVLPVLTRPASVGLFLATGIGTKDKSRTETEVNSSPKQSGGTRSKCIRSRGASALFWTSLEPPIAKVLQCHEPLVERQLSIPFTVTYGNVNFPLLLVHASVNGRPATLILDTGAQFLTITPELAEGLQPTGTVEHIGLGVRTQSTRVTVSVILGGVTLPHCAAETQDLSNLSNGLEVEIDGLIGESVLSQFKAVSIDYVNHLVNFTRI